MYIYIYIYVASMRFFNVNFCKPPVKSVNRCRLRRDEAVPTPRSLWSSGSRTGRSGLGTQDVLRNPAGKADEFSVILFCFCGLKYIGYYDTEFGVIVTEKGSKWIEDLDRCEKM